MVVIITNLLIDISSMHKIAAPQTDFVELPPLPRPNVFSLPRMCCATVVDNVPKHLQKPKLFWSTAPFAASVTQLDLYHSLLCVWSHMREAFHFISNKKLTWMIRDWEAFLLRHFACRSRKGVLPGNIYMKLRQVCSSFFPSKIVGFPCRMAEASFWGCMANSQKDRCMRDASALFTGDMDSTFEVAMCPVARS